MTRKLKSNQTFTSDRPTFAPFKNKCALCLKLHKKSKYFNTLYGLQYHLSEHRKDNNDVFTETAIAEINKLIPHIARAIELGMLS